LSEEEQANYNYHIKNLRNEASRMWTLKIDAEDRVNRERSIEIAKGMKLKSMNINDITGLSKDEIDKL